MADEPEEEEEEEQEECPKCPPVGAPAWMSTFADMATLLMAFFVLILSFAEMNVPKFKQISGSLKDSFGVQRLIPVVEQPKGTTILQMNFSPSPARSPVDNVTSDSTDETKPELEIPTDTDKSQGSDKLAEGEKNNEGLGGEDKGGKDDQQEKLDRLTDAIEKIASVADIEVKQVDGKVVVDLKAQNASPEEMANKLARVGEAVQIAQIATGEGKPEILFSGIDTPMTQLAAAVSDLQNMVDKKKGGAKKAQEASQTAAADKKAEMEADELRISLQEEISKGLVKVERRDGKTYVTLGSGGAFPSGSATLTSQARNILGKIAKASTGPKTTMTVTGHTDNVPISSERFRDNWDLAAARSSSVVQAVQDTGLIKADKMKAVSQGENKPIADNKTAEGREKNRRIEIEISY